MVRLETSIPGRGLDLLGSYGPPSALESASAAHPGQRGDRRRCRRDVSPRGCASLARGAVPAEPSGADRARTGPTSSTAPGRRVRSRRPGAPGADEHRVVNRLVAAWGTTDDQEYDGRADVSLLSRAFRVRPGAARGCCRCHRRRQETEFRQWPPPARFDTRTEALIETQAGRSAGSGIGSDGVRVFPRGTHAEITRELCRERLPPLPRESHGSHRRTCGDVTRSTCERVVSSQPDRWRLLSLSSSRRAIARRQPGSQTKRA